jgi:ABC-2 type transport system ATP-binding protein/lipopolysaccharide transport system ATP-binding protein
MVTHSLGLIRDLCDRAAWLDHGRIREIGDARHVADSYLTLINEREARRSEQPTSGSLGARRGSGEVRITGLEYLAEGGVKVPVLLAGAPATVRMHFEAEQAVPRAIFGLGFLHESGANVAGPNSGRTGAVSVPAGQGYIDFSVDALLLQPGTYTVSTAIVDRAHMFDYADREFELRVRGRGDEEPGLTRMPGDWSSVVMVDASETRRTPRPSDQEAAIARP